MKDYFEFEGFNDDFLIEINSSIIEDKSPFVVEAIALAVGETTKGIGNITLASAKKKEAEARILEIGGKRTAQFKSCETNKAYKKFLDGKYRRNRIKDCQNEAKKRLDAEEQEQKEIVRRMTAVEEGKLVSELDKSKSIIEEKKSGKKLYLITGIFGLILILGTIVYIKSKK